MNHGLDTGEQPYDERHEAEAPTMGPLYADDQPPVANGEHIGNDHQEPVNPWPLAPAPQLYPPYGSKPLPVRQPAQSFMTPETVREALAPGLSWQGGTGGPVRADLVNFDFAKPGMGVIPGPEVSNIELRTIYAHLLETAGRVRVEMRERGMQVDL